MSQVSLGGKDDLSLVVWEVQEARLVMIGMRMMINSLVLPDSHFFFFFKLSGSLSLLFLYDIHNLLSQGFMLSKPWGEGSWSLFAIHRYNFLYYYNMY